MNLWINLTYQQLIKHDIIIQDLKHQNFHPNLIQLDELYMSQRHAMDPNFDWKYEDMGCGNPAHNEPCPQSYKTDVYYHIK